MGDDGDMRLILVRHGETYSNLDHLLDTAYPGADLTPKGREQAESLVQRLAGEKIAAINVSDLVRTQQTAAPLAADRGLTPKIMAEGREIAAGDMEMSGTPEHVHEYVTTVFRWITHDPHIRLANGETGQEVLDRFDKQVADAVERAREAGVGAALVVAHGSVMRYWVGARSDVDLTFIARCPLPNTGIVILEGEMGETWRVQSYVDIPAADMADGIPDELADQYARFNTKY